MNDYFKKVLPVAFGTLLLLLSIGAPVASAQTSAGLQIKPAIVEDKVNPGEGHQYSLLVKNLSAEEKTFYVSVLDIKGVDDEGRPVFSEGNEVTGYELSSWVTLQQTTLVLAPEESKSVSFNVRVPAVASPGSHFASVFFSDKPEKPTASGSGVGFNVGAIVSLRISGDINEEAQLREFSTGKLIYGTADVDFNVKIYNPGNVLVQPGGFVEVSDMFGKKVGTVGVNEQLASTFPGSSRVYPAVWTSDSFAFGRYQAVASLVYGDDVRKTIYSTTSFWILPLVPIGIVLGILLGIVLAAYWMMRAYIRRKLRQMGAPMGAVPGYGRKYQQSSSRLMVITMSVILLCVFFLVVLFFMIA